ncbi:MULTISPECIES: dipeptidase PepE [Salegentibacter]|jgi:dipeptidase E|uniref:dipeptidase E n=1 Tax=Salegentibacter agarivorans TaxID=345907 RepID=A0A1I2JSR4_9FLAO|nr:MULTISPECIES: dipeptidase PepE [Salegentibacter]APS39047.1 (alpha)-aspartyl dipeptidase [Salegentibacter sp. T436]SFF57882.1 dipeptidase E [Salegentibacter agarivorans]
MSKALLASTSTLHGQDYLEYLIPELKVFFKNIDEVIFIPFARPGGISHTEYTKKASEAFNEAGINLRGIHEFEDMTEAITQAKGIFTGGGNTFLLVSELYRNKLMQPLKESIQNGAAYMGTSAGTNIAGLTMQTTNDMPIVYPPSFKTLAVVPFNINPHYLDPDSNSTHKGETRETRIKEFHTINTQPVIGLREGSWILVSDNKIELKGSLSARIFKSEKLPFEIETNSDLSELN